MLSKVSVFVKPHHINLISTITNQGKVRFMIYKNTMNSQTMIKFLKRLVKDADRKVFLVLDNLRVHHSYKVRDWLSEHEDQIELFFLPSYSPALNPDEYLNCDLKDGVHSGVPARSKGQYDYAFSSENVIVVVSTQAVRNQSNIWDSQNQRLKR